MVSKHSPVWSFSLAATSQSALGRSRHAAVTGPADAAADEKLFVAETQASRCRVFHIPHPLSRICACALPRILITDQVSTMVPEEHLRQITQGKLVAQAPEHHEGHDRGAPNER